MALRLVDASFPTELLLKVIELVPFPDGDAVAHVRNIAAIHPRTKQVLSTYENSLTKTWMRRQLRHAHTDFPLAGSKADRKYTYAWFRQCVRRYDAVDGIMDILTSDINCWQVERFNMPIINTGLLLLYRIFSIDGYVDKLSWIRSLSRDPLIAIFLAVRYSTRTARYQSQGLAHITRHGRFLDANQLELRTEIEFCFAEGALNLGPAFILEMLDHVDPAETKLMCLYHEHATHDWAPAAEGDFQPPVTQGPVRNPGTKQRSLWTTLLESLSASVGYPLSETCNRIEEEASEPGHHLAWVSLADKARLIEGSNVL